MLIHLFRVLISTTLLISTAQASSVFERMGWFDRWSERIEKDGVISIGYVPWYYPFSYTNSEELADGFSVEFSRLVAQEIGQQLQVKNLKVRFVPMLITEPFEELVSRRAAFECSATLNLGQAPRDLVFTKPFFVSSVHVLSDKKTPIRRFTDVAGKLFIAHEGKFQQWALKRLNDDLKLQVDIDPIPIIPATHIRMSEGGVAGIVGDALRLFNVLYAINGQDIYVAGGGHLGEVAYVCSTLAKDKKFLELLNASIEKTLKSRAYQVLYRKWFIDPAPSLNTRFNFPMTQGLRTLIQHSGGQVDNTLVGEVLPFSEALPSSFDINKSLKAAELGHMDNEKSDNPTKKASKKPKQSK